MPTIARAWNLRFVIYPNDHRPAHVHVIGAGCECVWHLHCPKGPPALRENYGFKAGQLQQIERYLIDHLAEACAEWSRIHGRP